MWKDLNISFWIEKALKYKLLGVEGILFLARTAKEKKKCRFYIWKIIPYTNNLTIYLSFEV